MSSSCIGTGLGNNIVDIAALAHYYADNEFNSVGQDRGIPGDFDEGRKCRTIHAIKLWMRRSPGCI